MANPSLFGSLIGKLIPAATARNSEGAPAYAFPPKHALAQYAATGCLHGTFYADAEEQLKTVLELAADPAVGAAFVAKTAILARQKGRMKDMPALLVAWLAANAPVEFSACFERVVDDPRMLRTFMQIVRSGQVGRKSFGTLPKRKIRKFLESRSDEQVFRGSIGNAPSLGDVVKMVHPRPATDSRRALYGWLIGKEHDRAALPEIVRQFEAWKENPTDTVPDVPFLMLTGTELTTQHWVAIAKNATWQQTRMNLATFARHGVFETGGMAERIAAKLSDREAVAKAKPFPYQLMVAAASCGADVPRIVKEALYEAMEIATECIPRWEGRVVVCPDVSGSMSSPVTGRRGSGTTAVRCVDVAALVAASVLRRNPQAEVIPFATDVVNVDVRKGDTVFTNAQRLAAVCGGGTSTSSPIRRLNERKAAADLVILVSDNESWVDGRGGRGTATLREWNALRKRNPGAKLVCLDLQPNSTTQATEREDVMNIGGFSDAVFEVIGRFADGTLDAGHWVAEIEKIEL